MALSQQVEYSLREAQEALRNSLAFSARTVSYTHLTLPTTPYV